VARIVAAAGVPCQVAGGLRDAAAVAQALATGADRAILGSALVRSPALGGELVAQHGADAIVAAIDVRDGHALGDGWVPGAQGTPALELITRLAETGVRWFAVTAIARDGLLEGPDLALLAAAQDAAPDARIIASAGVSSTDDIRSLVAGGYAGAILGRALYEGRVALPEALAITR
jgi:phosphoribosylformimino-5-aminoimidazole carboxamide ribotide isomerase